MIAFGILNVDAGTGSDTINIQSTVAVTTVDGNGGDDTFNVGNAGLVSGILGALTVGVASNWYSRLMDHPAIIPQVPGILMLVPGSVGFRGLAALLR